MTVVRSVIEGPCGALRSYRVPAKRGIIVGSVWDGNHSDSNNKLLLISLISSILWRKVCYSGKSVAVVFAPNEAPSQWKTFQNDQFAQFSAYTYFCPFIIRIWLGYHLHLGTEKEKQVINQVMCVGYNPAGGAA